MTPQEEELMRLQVQMMMAKKAESGMSSPYVDNSAREAAQARAGVSTAGMESKLKAQQAIASKMRSQGPAQGKEVGPLGVYMAPNWAEALSGAVTPALGGFMEGRLSDDYDAVDSARSDAALAKQELAQMDLQDSRMFTTGEREAGEEHKTGERIRKELFDSVQNGLQRGLQKSIANASNATSRDNTQANIGSRENIAGRGIDAGIAAADLATTNRRAESMEGGNYTLNGKIQHIVKDSTGKFRLGTVDGMEIPAEVMVNAVDYTPGTDKGTLGDAESFTVPPEDQGQAPPSFVGNLLTSDYFDSSTGMFNPTRWTGAVGLGADGDMIKATQSQMATTTLGQMAQRMEVINLRPWTEKEIETITMDFPGPNSKYPDWANLTTNILRPDIARRFDEAIALGNATEETKAEVLMQMDHDTIAGARKNGMKMKDLEQLGMPRETITAYLRTLGS